MANYSTTQFGVMAGTDDGEGIAASASRLFGPWEDETALVAFLAQITGEANPTIPNALFAAFKQPDNTFALKQWMKAEGMSIGYWREIDAKRRVIVIAGVLENGIPTINIGNQPNADEATIGDEANVYCYDNGETCFFGLSTDGGAHYVSKWVNYPEFGELLNGKVVPYLNAIYLVPSNGQLMMSSLNNLEPAEGGLSPEVQAKLDSLLALNLTFAGDSMSYKDPISGQTKTVNFQQGGAVTDTYTYAISPSANLSIAGIDTQDIEVVVTPLGGANIANVRPPITCTVKSGTNVTLSTSESITNNVLTFRIHVKSNAVGEATVAVVVDGTETDIAVTVTSVAVTSLQFVGDSLAFNGTDTVSGKIAYLPKNATFTTPAIDTAHKTESYSAAETDWLYSFVTGLSSATVGTIDRDNGTIDFTAVLEKVTRQDKNNYEVGYKGTSMRDAVIAMTFDGGAVIQCKKDDNNTDIFFPCPSFDRSTVGTQLSKTLTNGNANNQLSTLNPNEVTIANSGVTRIALTKRANGDNCYAVAVSGLEFGDEIYVDCNANMNAEGGVLIFMKDSGGTGILPPDGEEMHNSDYVPHISLKKYAAGSFKFGENAGVYFQLDAMQGEVYNSSNPTNTSTVAKADFQLDPTLTDMKVIIAFRAMNTTAAAPVVYVKHND